MYSVTQRVKSIPSPSRYAKTNWMHIEEYEDYERIQEIPGAFGPIQGTLVDYLTRIEIGESKEKAFSVSLKGAAIVGEEERATALLNRITDLSDSSILAACELVRYDVALRKGEELYKIEIAAQRELADSAIPGNIRTMVKRSKLFLLEKGGEVQSGITFDGGYNDIISSGDADFLTKNGLWDFKVSSRKPSPAQVLQILTYYVLGVHSAHKAFENIAEIGIFNPFLNKCFYLPLNEVSDDIFSKICHDIVGYVTPKKPEKWRSASGTDANAKNEEEKKLKKALQSTAFCTENYDDGIYEITVDDYWTFFRPKALYGRPAFRGLDKIIFLKSQGYFMFVGASQNGRYYLMQGGRQRKLDKPLTYYYENLADYAETVLEKLSPVWDTEYQIADFLRTIRPEKEKLKPYYVEEAEELKLEGEPVPTFKKWLKESEPNFRFYGKVHGCIIDVSFFTHLYVNPLDGSITPYEASSSYDKLIYPNLHKMIEKNSPEMLADYEKKISVFEKQELLTSGKNNTFALLSDRLSEQNNDSEQDKMFSYHGTEIYDISRKLMLYQSIYEEGWVKYWNPNVLGEETPTKKKRLPPQQKNQKTNTKMRQIKKNNEEKQTVIIQDNQNEPYVYYSCPVCGKDWPVERSMQENEPSCPYCKNGYPAKKI